MPSGKKPKKLGRGMSHVLDGSFASLVQPESGGTAGPFRPEVQAPPPEPAAGGAAELSTRAFDVITVCSGKGGTGKSVLTSNLGVLLGSSIRLTILDADLGLANLHILCDLMPSHDVSDVLSGRKALEEIMMRGPRGISLIPGGSGIPELASLTHPMLDTLVDEVGRLDRLTDLLLVDAPSGIDRQALIFLLASDQAIVVATEDITALTDAYAVIKTIFTHRPEVTVVLVVNQARSHEDGMEAFNKVAHVARKFLGRELALGGVIPFDERVEWSVAERQPVVLSHPDCPASRAMASLAGRVGLFHSRSPRAVLPFGSRLRRALAAPPLSAY